MRGNSSEETLHDKQASKRLVDTHGDRVCAYRSDNQRSADTQFKEAVQNCGQQINYCGVGSHHQNEILEHMIKELTLGSWTLLLQDTRLWKEAESTMLCTLSLKEYCQRYNSLEID